MRSELKALATRVLRDIERDKAGTERSGNVPLPQSPWDISVPPESQHSEVLSLADEECPAVPAPYAWDSGTFPVQPGHAAGQERDKVEGTPDWHDVDAWRARLRAAVDIPARRAVVADWAIAAGGRVEHDLLVLPPDLPRRLARAEMTAMASYVGIRWKMQP
jgi:hypothetical protein